MKNQNGTTLPRMGFSMPLEAIIPYVVFRKMGEVQNTSRDFTASVGS